MTKIFADSNFFIALFNPSDTLHNRALLAKEKLEKDGYPVVISNFVFLESVTVLSQRMGRESAIFLGKHLVEDENFEWVYVDERLQDASWAIFKQTRKKNMGLVDCSHLAIMQAEGISRLLTFDEEDFSNLRKVYDFSFY